MSKSLTQTILETMRKLPSVSAGWRANSGGKQGRVTLLPQGFPDLFGRFRDGVCWYIEVKAYPDAPSAKQVEFLDGAERDGCFCCVAYGDRDVAEALVKWLLVRQQRPTAYRWRVQFGEARAEAKRRVA